LMPGRTSAATHRATPLTPTRIRKFFTLAV
jgi:hypothetical protein